MQAVILAGGLGTRLRPVVNDVPKPMAPVLGKPFLEYQVLALKRRGITDLVFLVGYCADLIRAYFKDGTRWGEHIAYATEAQPLGTAGALKHAAAQLDKQFLVVNGDTLIDLDINWLIAFHRAHQALATLALTPQADPRAYGSVILDNEGRITAFREKKALAPSQESASNGGPTWVNAGMYVMERAVLDFIPVGKSTSLETDTFPQLIANHSPLYGLGVTGYFIDIGTAPAYAKFEQDLRAGRIHVD